MRHFLKRRDCACKSEFTKPRSITLSELTRSQAVARIADRTASQHLWGHVRSSVTWPFDTPYVIFYWWSFGTKPLSLTVSEIFNVKCNAMVDITLIRPLNKGQRSRSFILVPIDFSYTISYSFIHSFIHFIWLRQLSIVTFALGRTV